MTDSVPKKKTAADGHEYHVSATANATVAPTNEATLALAVPGSQLGQKALEFITCIHYEWTLKGELDHAEVAKSYGYTKEEYEAYLGDSGVVSALIDRGINPRHLVTKHDVEIRSKLTPIQLMVANAMLDLVDTRSQKKKLQDHGINSATYQMWLRDPEFSDYLRQRAESLIGDNQHEAMIALMDKVSGGDLKAIQYYHELTGRYVQQASTPVGTNNQDLHNIVVRMVEIIIDEVDDQDTAARIADRIKGLVIGNQVAHALTGPTEVIVPEIAQGREMTPEIQALMNKGAGFND